MLISSTSTISKKSDNFVVDLRRIARTKEKIAVYARPEGALHIMATNFFL